MSTTPTQFPVPSEKPQDLKFNAGKIDEFVTSMAQQYIDRFGQAHYTIEGLRWVAQQAIAAFGYITLDSFEDGNTLTLPNQVLRLESTGEYYRWDGPLPKVVPAGSTPETAGGIGISKWLSVGDATLRNDLSKDNGALLVDGGSIVEFKKILSFDTGGTVTSNREAVRYTDGFWYIWGGSYPKTIGSSTPETDTNWKNVGQLTGYAANDAQNFGFTSGMADALPSLNAMIRSPFFKMFFPMCSTINIADKWAMRSFVDIDFNGSTIDWKGPILDSSNKSNPRNVDIIHTEDFGGGTLGSYENIFIRNLNILGNDVGVGINIRNVSRFGIKNVNIEKCQCNGINVSNSQLGFIEEFRLVNCSPRSDLGFTSDDIEAFGDGIAVWYGSTNTILDNGVISVSDTSRGGRAGIAIDGHFHPGGIATREISVNNVRVYGYDRPFHSELCGVVTVTNSTFEYTSTDKHQFIKCAAVIWNVLEPTVMVNVKLISDRSILKTAGIKAKLIKVVATSTTIASPFFISGPEENGVVEFDGCDLHNVGGGWGAYNCSMIFDKCNLTTDASPDLMDIGGETSAQNVSFYNSRIIGINISGNNLKSNSVLKLSGCDITKDVNSGPLSHLYISNSNIQGEVTANTVLRYNGQMPKVLHYLQNVNQQYNGMWLGTGKPAGAKPDGSGDWLRGDTVINLDAVESEAFEWKCVTTGSPGRWAVSGTLGAGL
ncbi:TPA: hypothetical protein ACTYMO_003855 [Citrobacter freundii]|uniref:tail fiber/spike domain-containing protein n=1 Tax=Citrobacter freundii TaxID=546 RepID=UPI003773B1C0